MNTLRYIATLFIIGISLQLNAQRFNNDTVFIQKDKLYGTAQSIYFDHHRNSKKHEVLNNWTFSEFDNDPFQWSLNYLKEHQWKLTKATPILPYKKWLPLNQYQGKFYIYYPCDFYTHTKQSINDTAFIDWTGEGPVANKIIYQKKIDTKTYKLQLSGMYEPNRKLIIHIIDPKKCIAIFEKTTNDSDKEYYLMIAAEKIRSMPLIVNNCKEHKQRELHFEVTDYLELLKKK